MLFRLGRVCLDVRSTDFVRPRHPRQVVVDGQEQQLEALRQGSAVHTRAALRLASAVICFVIFPRDLFLRICSNAVFSYKRRGDKNCMMMKYSLFRVVILLSTH
jgi:hypothetical protein